MNEASSLKYEKENQMLPNELELNVDNAQKRNILKTGHNIRRCEVKLANEAQV